MAFAAHHIPECVRPNWKSDDRMKIICLNNWQITFSESLNCNLIGKFMTFYSCISYTIRIYEIEFMFSKKDFASNFFAQIHYSLSFVCCVWVGGGLSSYVNVPFLSLSLSLSPSLLFSKYKWLWCLVNFHVPLVSRNVLDTWMLASSFFHFEANLSFGIQFRYDFLCATKFMLLLYKFMGNSQAGSQSGNRASNAQQQHLTSNVYSAGVTCRIQKIRNIMRVARPFQLAARLFYLALSTRHAVHDTYH